MIQSCKKVNVYVALVISLMQCKMFIMNYVLFHVKRDHSQDCNSMMVLQDCMDVVKGDPGSCNEACSESSDDGNQVYGLKIEEDTDIKEEDDSEQINCPVTGTESEVSLGSACPALQTFYKYSEVCTVFLISICVAVCPSLCHACIFRVDFVQLF
jgi:hypothetical protein